MVSLISMWKLCSLSRVVCLFSPSHHLMSRSQVFLSHSMILMRVSSIMSLLPDCSLLITLSLDMI